MLINIYKIHRFRNVKRSFFLRNFLLSTSCREDIKELNKGLKDVDFELCDIIEKEKRRQYETINLIPSENFTSKAVLEALGSIMQNKYSEGYPGSRYYGGNEMIDESERLCQTRALETFRLDPDKWGVNVQPLSGAVCNLYVYYAILKVHDRLMGLDLSHGGHLSHGYQTRTKKISAVSAYFETMPYLVNQKTGLIDYDALQKSALLYHPKLIVAGASSYPRHIDYAKMKEIAESVGAYLMVDMAHISGLVAAGVMPTPFNDADIVTTTSHKSLRGPRGSIIFFRKGIRRLFQNKPPLIYDLEDKINASVFPGHQGGPHNHTIAALAVALKQAQSSSFKEYQTRVLANSACLARQFQKMGYNLVSGGTDNHLLLIDLRSKNIDGARVEAVLDEVNITLNKNTIPGDLSAMIPSGIRMGSPAMTTRGLIETDFEKIAEFVDQAIRIAININMELPSLKLSEYKTHLIKETSHRAALSNLKKEVTHFARAFPAVGFDETTIKYR